MPQSQRCAWWRQFLVDGEVHPCDLPQLTAWADDDETEAGDGERPADSTETAVAKTVSPSPLGEAGVAVEVPLKIRHLKVAADRGRLEAMYLLAQECDDRTARIHWLTMAAERGHVPAMHDLGLASAALHERRRWLLRAARHGWAESMAELGDVECS